MAGKIPVAVVAGFEGSGKTDFLSRYLREQADGGISTVVVTNEAGAPGFDHSRVEFLGPTVALRDTGCLCCSVQGPLVETLRGLFFQALRKSIPPFTRVIIALGGQEDCAAARFTLQYERFLHERFSYAGCLTLVDAVFGHRHLNHHPKAAQQVVLADVLAIDRAEQAVPEALRALRQALTQLNPFAIAHDLRTSSATEILAQVCTGRDGPRRRPAQSIRAIFPTSRPWVMNIQYETLSFGWSAPLPRSEVTKALEAVASCPEIEMLSLKGAFRYLGSPARWTVDGVHQVVYPNQPQPIDAGASGDYGCELVLTYRSLQRGARHALVSLVLEHLPNAVLSGDDNSAA